MEDCAGLVSIVIPAHNPESYLREAIASARRQTHNAVETILVDDGSCAPGSQPILKSASRLADRYIEQTNQGLPAARNAGIRAASGSLVVPLDADDTLDADYVACCLAALRAHPEAAFVYTDYRVFGAKKYVERTEDYNLYRLLRNNTLPYAALIRKQDWEAAGGYNESLRLGCEDWDFWLRLAERGRFGLHLGKVLFRYRKHGRSLWDVAREHYDEIAAQIRSDHAALYAGGASVRIKARWEPAVCVVGGREAAGQTIQDWEAIEAEACDDLLRRSRAEAFLIPAAGGGASESAELAALAVWGGKGCVRLPDGSVGASRAALARHRNAGEVEPGRSLGSGLAIPRHSSWSVIRRHLTNAELLSLDIWLRHPLRSAGRLIPLRTKMKVNRLAKRPIFNLAFYLGFQPEALPLEDSLGAPLCYCPHTDAGRPRIALITPHLGPGGAERVLMEIAGALDRCRCEILLLATHSRDERWLPLWRQRVDHVYALSHFVSPDRLVAAVYSIIRNWSVGSVLVQNALAGYAALPHLKKQMPGIRILDLVHSVGDRGDLVSSTAAVAGEIDLRVVISEAGRRRLRCFGTSEEKIRLIRSGVDLDWFAPVAQRRDAGLNRVLFAGRLDAVKRPLLLADIALAVRTRRPQEDFTFVVAGDGPEEEPLRRRVRRAGIAHLFEFLGHVPDLAPVLADADLVLMPSENEGVPLVVLEAFASAKPVVASDVGALSEVVARASGILIARSPGEVQAFAEAIDLLLSQPFLRERMGLAGRRKVEAEHDLRKARQAYGDLFA
jgi:glycosyltransferase involved in cell wall biosynthesis/GT2 family glycosyltransferase